MILKSLNAKLVIVAFVGYCDLSYGLTKNGSFMPQIYWGHSVYGVEAASALYFGRDASFLTLGESAMLVGIIPAPDRLSPLRELSRCAILVLIE